MGEIKKEAPAPKLKVKAVFCFAIEPEYKKARHCGLASKPRLSRRAKSWL